MKFDNHTLIRVFILGVTFSLILLVSYLMGFLGAERQKTLCDTVVLRSKNMVWTKDDFDTHKIDLKKYTPVGEKYVLFPLKEDPNKCLYRIRCIRNSNEDLLSITVDKKTYDEYDGEETGMYMKYREYRDVRLGLGGDDREFWNLFRERIINYEYSYTFKKFKQTAYDVREYLEKGGKSEDGYDYKISY